MWNGAGQGEKIKLTHCRRSCRREWQTDKCTASNLLGIYRGKKRHGYWPRTWQRKAAPSWRSRHLCGRGRRAFRDLQHHRRRTVQKASCVVTRPYKLAVNALVLDANQRAFINPVHLCALEGVLFARIAEQPRGVAASHPSQHRAFCARKADVVGIRCLGHGTPLDSGAPAVFVHVSVLCVVVLIGGSKIFRRVDEWSAVRTRRPALHQPRPL